MAKKTSTKKSAAGRKKKTGKPAARKKPAPKKKPAARKKAAKKKKKAAGRKAGTKRAVAARQTVTSKAGKKPRFYEDMEELARDRAVNWGKLSKQRRKAEEVLNKHRKRLALRKNVTGMHVALKKKAGKIVRPLRYVICIHVDSKPGKKDAQPKNPIKRKLDGVPTDVIQMVYRRLEGEAAPVDKVFDPLQGGLAISRQQDAGDFGTLGMIVFHFGQEMLLTNQHVAGKEGDVIRQPPSDDNLEFEGQEIIGTTFAIGAAEDCAIIQPNATRRVAQQIFDLTAVSDSFIEGELDQMDEHVTRVFKIGARTGLTEGTVEAIGADVHIPGQRTFVGQILVKGENGMDIIEGGDSGSVLLKKEEREMGVVFRVVGLVHAETEAPKFLVATPFRDVKKALDIRLHSRFS